MNYKLDKISLGVKNQIVFTGFNNFSLPFYRKYTPAFHNKRSYMFH